MQIRKLTWFALQSEQSQSWHRADHVAGRREHDGLLPALLSCNSAQLTCNEKLFSSSIFLQEVGPYQLAIPFFFFFNSKQALSNGSSTSVFQLST